MVRTYHTDTHAFLERNDIEISNSSYPALTRIEINDNAEYQSILGFGTALTDSACYLLHNAEADLRENIIKKLFDEEGIELNLARLSVAASDYSKDCFSYNDNIDDVEMKNFSTAHDEEYVIPTLQDISEKYPQIGFVSSAWSPPGWMKTGDEMTGGWMREKYIEAYAEYYFRFIKSYAEYGIKISALTPQNETETDQVCRMPACLLHPELEMKFTILLRKKLEAAGLNPEIWIVDHNYIHWNRAKWMLDNVECKKAVQGVAFHYYEGNAGMLGYLHELHSDIGFHITEGGPDLCDDYEDVSCKFAVTITNAMRNWCKSFITWNAVLDENGYPNLGPYSCAGLLTLDSKEGAIRVSGHYRALAHFSKFVKRGAKRVESCLKWYGQEPSDEQRLPVSHCAFKNEDGSLVIVLTNTGKKEEVLLRVKGENYRIMLKEKSVCTVVLED